MIGRRPHEILLKRQSERPFKDQLTLQDYGVSNNVQLDLEVDTGKRKSDMKPILWATVMFQPRICTMA